MASMGNRKSARGLAVLCGLALLNPWLGCDTGPETDRWFVPRIEKPSYPYSGGPRILIDAGHFNTHTLEDRYQSLAALARADGYRAQSFSARFSSESLARADILVVANALHERNRVRRPPAVKNWALPTPSAFDPDEIEAMRHWVEGGGALLLLADHMPFAGAAADLAAVFGIHFDNSFAIDAERERSLGDTAEAVSQVAVFDRAGGGLADHAISRGRNPAERVNSVATFGGHAFRADENVMPLLVMGPSTVSLMPQVAWEFSADTPRRSAAGWLQAAALHFGEGRVAVFGEVGLFGVQTSETGVRVGFNSAAAGENPRFLLNVLHWLSGLLEDAGSATRTGEP